MHRWSILKFIKQLKQPVFTTRELALLSGKSLSVTTQALNVLEKNGLVFRVYKGVWAEAGNEKISPYIVIPSLFPAQRTYVSFISALHLYGIIEQIPQVVTLASIAHTKTIRTKVGIYQVHRIAPSFFNGFVWYKGIGNFLIAKPEKALVDSLYLSACKKRQFGYFPELHFPKTFSFTKVKSWIKEIPSYRIRSHIDKKLDIILKKYKMKD